jgi:hypothetical protein
MRLFENLLAYDEPIVMTTITAPSLSWDEESCRPLGDHKCSGKLGCQVQSEVARAYNLSAFKRLSALHKQAYQATYREYGAGALRRLAYAPELQLRGVVHWHVALGFAYEHRAAAAFYVSELHARSADHWYGFVDRKLEPALPGRAAYYLSKYMVKAHNAQGGLPELIVRREAPERPVGVDRRLTAATKCTMRNLRFRRHLYLRWGRRLPAHEVEAIRNVLQVFPGATLRPDAAIEPSAIP